MAKRGSDNSIEQRIWKALARERNSRGITQVYVSEALGLSPASVSQLETRAVGHSLSRLRDYGVKVLRCKITLEFPGGVSLTPIERTTEITRSD